MDQKDNNGKKPQYRFFFSNGLIYNTVKWGDKRRLSKYQNQNVITETI